MRSHDRNTGRKATSRAVAAALVTLAAFAPGAACAFTLFGSPDLLAPGQFKSLPFTLFGEQVTPRLDLNGSVRYLTLGERLQGQTLGIMAPQVDVEVNLQLTATQRIHGLWRPLERNFRDNTFDVFEPNRGWTVRTSGEPYNLFYEGQPFNWLTPGDSFPLDVTVAGGRLPLFLHNGLWFNNTLDGFALSKNNLQAGTLSNLNVVYFLTRGQPHGGITPFEKAEARKRVMGLYADADWYEYFVEASWAVAYDNARGPKGADLNRNFWAVSITRTAGFAGLTFRALGSTANDTRDAGVLFVLEGEKEFLDVRGYAVVFGATADWLPVSEEAATMSREGILFTFDRLAPTPGLNPRGSDSVGGVLGIIFNPRGLITVTPEVGWLLDTSSQRNHQFGAALQLQADLASLLVPAARLTDLRSRGVLYGALVRLTLVEIHNENNGIRGKPDDYGARLELIHRF